VTAPKGRPAAVALSVRTRASQATEEPTRLQVVNPALDRADYQLAALKREWLADLKYLRRSPETIRWYTTKISAFLDDSGLTSVDQLVPGEVKDYIARLGERGLSDETVHGFFATVKAFASWADREGYPIDPTLLKMRGPAVSKKEREVYSERQRAAIFEIMPAGWPLMAVQILLGTGMRISELCGLRLEDFEDDEEAGFLKIQRGKGAKFRRAPISERLRRDITRYVNRVRPESPADRLLLLPDGRPLGVQSVSKMLTRAGRQLGFRLHAHKFRHTFATTYIENGGDIERLRKILGHSTYAMILRYVHLNKRDLHHEFEDRTPY
jgi:site-specific recombinase XerD